MTHRLSAFSDKSQREVTVTPIGGCSSEAMYAADVGRPITGSSFRRRCHVNCTLPHEFIETYCLSFIISVWTFNNLNEKKIRNELLKTYFMIIERKSTFI